jgi:hypothetical protein
MTAKLSFLFAMSLLIAACSPDAAKPPSPEMTLAQFLDRHSDARGGKEAIENVHAVETAVDVTEPTFQVSGSYRATRDGWVRIDIFAGGERVFTEALGPDGGWQMFADETVGSLSPEGEAALRRGEATNLYGLHELAGLGYELKFLGETARNSGAYWEIEKIGPDGFSVHLFFDRDTYLLASEMQTAALHPDVDATEIRSETFHSNYEAVAGMLFANHEEKRNLDTGEVMQTIIVTSRVINPEVDPALFARPVVARDE